jgi:hypothetical protein
VLKNGRYSTVEPRKNNETVQLMQISATGEIVGDSRAIGGKLFGFKYRRGIFKPIIYPGADQTTPYGLNDNGVIVGSFLINGSEQSCFALVGSEYLRVRFPGAVQQMNCFDVNNTGQIVGGYFDGTSFHGFLITPGQ